MLLMTKALANRGVAKFLTAMLERVIVVWKLAHSDLPNPWAILNMKAAEPHSYPFVVPLVLSQVSFAYDFMTLFFVSGRIDVRKNATLWKAFGFLAVLGVVDLGLFTVKLQGRKGWDWFQLGALRHPATWILVRPHPLSGTCKSVYFLLYWRLFDLHQVIRGVKTDVHEHSVSNLVLSFGV